MEELRIAIRALTDKEIIWFRRVFCKACGNMLGEFKTYGIFDAETNEPICWECGKKNDSDLVGALIKFHQDKKEFKEKLLSEYAQKEPIKFYQIDVWPNHMMGQIAADDENGLGTEGRIVYELRRSGNPLRIQIHESADLNDVLKGLDNAKKWVQRYMNSHEDLFNKSTTPGFDIPEGIPF